MKRRRRLAVELLEDRLVPSTYNLHQGDNLQKTVHAAQPGDTILLDAGATFGPVVLEAKSNPNNLMITIATNQFPLAAGVRVGPGNTSAMAQIASAGLDEPDLAAVPGAGHDPLRGLE